MLELIGLIIGGTILFGILKGASRSFAAGVRRKKRNYDEALTAAAVSMSEGNFRFPSWRNDTYRLSTFSDQLCTELVSNGASASEIDPLKINPDFLKIALTVADAFETRGFSFSEQIVGVSDFMALALKKGLAKDIVNHKEPKSAPPGSAHASLTKHELRIGGVLYPINSDGDRDNEALLSNLKNRFEELCSMDLDFYLYLMSECYRFSKGGADVLELLDATGITRWEYETISKDADKYPDHQRVSDWVDEDVIPDLENLFGPEANEIFRGALFTYIFSAHEEAVKEIRLRYAMQNYENCMSSGHPAYAEKWKEVIDTITREKDDPDDEIPF